MHHPKDRILGRRLAIEGQARMSGARGTEPADGPSPSITKPWLDAITQPVDDGVPP